MIPGSVDDCERILCGEPSLTRPLIAEDFLRVPDRVLTTKNVVIGAGIEAFIEVGMALDPNEAVSALRRLRLVLEGSMIQVDTSQLVTAAPSDWPDQLVRLH